VLFTYFWKKCIGAKWRQKNYRRQKCT
jgi:hypothetical protein